MWVRNVHCERKGGGETMLNQKTKRVGVIVSCVYRTLKDDGWWRGHKEQTIMEIVLTQCKKRIHY